MWGQNWSVAFGLQSSQNFNKIPLLIRWYNPCMLKMNYKLNDGRYVSADYEGY